MSAETTTATGVVTVTAKKTGYRWVIVWILWVLYMINFMDRTSVMTLLPFIKEDLGITFVQAGFISSVFFFGYAFANFISGILADKLGAKKVMYIAIAVFSFATFFTGLAHKFSTFIMLRLGLGLGEGCHLTPANKTIAEWFPHHEKGRATSIFSTTFQLAPAVVPILATQLMALFGGQWRPVFYFLAIPGIIGIFLLWYFIENTPEEEMAKKGRINKEEYDYIVAGLHKTQETAQKVSTVAILKVLLRDRSFWIFSLVCFFNLSVLWGIMTWVTSFLYNQHGFDIKTMGWITSSFYAFAVLGIIFGGYLVDKVFKGKTKYAISIGFYPVIAVLWFLTTIPKGNIPLLVLSLIVIGILINIPAASIYSYCALRYPKEMVGTALGFSSGIGQFGSFLGPFIAGYLVSASASGDASFIKVFMMFAVCSFICATLALLLQNTPKKVESLS